MGKKHYFPQQYQLSHQELNEFFAQITPEEQERFLEAWANLVQEEVYIAYDLTVLSQYSKEISLATASYYRDYEYLAQNNLVVFLRTKE